MRLSDDIPHLSQLIAMVLLAGWVQPSTCQETPQWKQRFLSEAPEKWQAYRSYAQRFQGTYEWTENAVKGTAREELLGSRGEWKQSGGWSLSTALNRGNQPLKSYVLGVNSKYAFLLEKPREQGEWVITEVDLGLAKSKTRTLSPLSLNQQQRSEKTLDLACSLLNCEVKSSHLLPNMVKDPEFVLKDVVPVERDGRTFVRVDFIDLPPRPTQYRWGLDGWVLLDPDHHWVVKEGEFKAQLNGGETGTIRVDRQYKVNKAGYPIPTGVTLRNTYQYFDEKQRLLSREAETIWRFELVERETVPEHEFSLSAFDLPEPKGHEIPQPSKWWLWFIVMAVASLGLGAFFRWRVRRRKIASESSTSTARMGEQA